jgi:hypothetical protein
MSLRVQTQLDPTELKHHPACEDTTGCLGGPVRTDDKGADRVTPKTQGGLSALSIPTGRSGRGPD